MVKFGLPALTRAKTVSETQMAKLYTIYRVFIAYSTRRCGCTFYAMPFIFYGLFTLFIGSTLLPFVVYVTRLKGNSKFNAIKKVIIK